MVTESITFITDSNTVTINKNELTLRQSIELEMQEEALFEKRLELFKKKFLKQKSNRKYKLVSSIEESDIIVLLNKYDLSKYMVVVNDGKNGIVSEDGKKLYAEFYLKNKNPRDRRLNTIGDITNGRDKTSISKKSFFFNSLTSS